MALFSFGKKDKKAAEVTGPVAKTAPNPPKIQTPPGSGSFPTIKPPQPTGLMPSGGMPSGSVTTQPMASRTGLRPTRPVPRAPRSTQRIVLPGTGNATSGAASSEAIEEAGLINLPVGMVLRCLPEEVLSSSIGEFESTGAAATEIGLPMQPILNQLPSGKVEMTLQDIVPYFPPGFLQPVEAITAYLPTVINLPLMDVVMRIPPDLLALRPDQKDVDASVINMADPFTEEILREQAEFARRQSQPKIIEESQVPHEEFVPRDQARTVAPPRRPYADPLVPTRPVASTPGPIRAPAGISNSALAPIAAQTSSGGLPAPSPGGTIPLPSRASGVLPTRPPGPPLASDPPPAASSAPVPPVPRHTGPIPAPPPPRHTTSLPTIQRRSGSLASLTSPAPSPALAPQPETAAEDAAEKNDTGAEANHAAPADENSDDLQRLAALAMAQLGDSNEGASAEASSPESGSTVRMEPIRAPASEFAPEPEPAQDSAPEGEEPAPVSSEPRIAIEEAPVATDDVPVAFNLNTCSADDMVNNIAGCSPALAESILRHRDKIGSYRTIADLLDVPGMTKAAYINLTGEEPPANRVQLSLNELLGFAPDQAASLKDVTDRIACWPDVTGCMLSQNSGLSLVGTVPPGMDKEAVVAFAPRMFEAINKSFSELAGQETDALLIPTPGTSYHLFRNRDLYLIILCRLPQMPERHMKVARLVLAALSERNG